MRSNKRNQLIVILLIALATFCGGMLRHTSQQGLTTMDAGDKDDSRISLAKRLYPKKIKALSSTKLDRLLSVDGNDQMVSKTIIEPSGLIKTNLLMLFFYSTLGSVMPFIPLYYRFIGLSGKYLLR